MKHRKISMVQGAHAARLAALAALAASCLPAAAQYTISQVPMLVASAPPANIVLTIDDSGSMAWAYVPDILTNYKDTAAFASSSFNALYYNPATTYTVPMDATGKTQIPLASGYALSSFNAAYYDGFNPDRGSVNLATSYTPTLSYSPGSFAPVSANGGTTGPAYYNVYVGGPGCFVPNPTQPPPPDSCFQTVTVSTNSGPGGTDETQNFANWYSFYRTRHLSIISAATRALQDPTLANVRIAWQALDSCNTFSYGPGSCAGWRGDSFDNRIRKFSGTHKADFYNWITQLPAANSTPTRVAWARAGQYFSDPTLGANGPYGQDPNQTPTVQGPELLCAGNFNVTLTDGLWNTGNEGGQTAFCGGSVCGNQDAQTTPLPDGMTYVPSTAGGSTAIYGDGVDGGDSDIPTGGLADIAFYYWANNLRPDLTGFYVPPYYPDGSTNNPATGNPNDPYWPYWNPNNDPASWPHMVNFTVGVGLTGFLQLPGLVWSGNAHAGAAYNNLLTGAPNCTTPTINCTWPEVDLNASGGGFAGLNAGNGNVYDLWHAAINSRGSAFSAESPDDLVNAMGAIITRIEGQTRGNSAAAGSSPSLTAGTQLFVASYNGSDWHGAVSAYAVDPNTGNVATTATWQTSAASIAPFASRAVFTAATPLPGNGTAQMGQPGIAFSVKALGTAGLLPYFGADLATQTQVVDYVLGDATYEQRNGGALRNRTVTPLGDIVDSNPLYSWNESFANYVLLPEGQGANGYAAFVATKGAAGRPQMVYAGANDGMLHGFDATTGAERFAYVPHTVIPNLSALDNPNYLHEFTVDGPVFVGDAYFGVGAAAPSWHSVLVGATGAGGPGVFALDVTNPQTFGAGNVLWDLDAAPAPFGNGDKNLGSTIGRPIIARLNNGDWAAVFGNGYLSANNCPVLYIVRLADGLARTINATPPATGTSCLNAQGTNANGLGTPTLLDIDQNGTTDYIYAGDLQGNLWKFDVSSANPVNWGVAYTQGASPAPLYRAVTSGGVPQPIVSAPNLGPSLGNAAGFLVYFATGKLFATGDPTDLTTQSVYAVQDQGYPILASRGGNMVAQAVQAAADGSGNENITTPYQPVNLAVQDGWYIDLPGQGERSINEPILVGGMLMFSTVIPQSQPCNGGCGGFVYAVSAFTGDGGLHFLTSPTTGNTYDALATVVGCVKGLTLINRNSTLNIYVSGNGPPPPATTSGGGSPLPGGNVPGPNLTTPPPSIWHLQGALSVPGRISWHEVTQ